MRLIPALPLAFAIFARGSALEEIEKTTRVVGGSNAATKEFPTFSKWNLKSENDGIWKDRISHCCSYY
jgi:hypothetical protein